LRGERVAHSANGRAASFTAPGGMRASNYENRALDAPGTLMSTQLKPQHSSTELDHDPSIATSVQDVPNGEPWMKVSLAGIVPLVLAFYLPAAFRPIPFVAGGLLVLCGIVMLIRQERRKESGVRE
jgi:hypothetical protein